MSNTFIPNTGVKAQILTPSTPSGFVSLFLENGERGSRNNLASLNAGTSNIGSVFAVGLSGINGAFSKTLSKAGQNTALYQTIHQKLYSDSGTALEFSQSNFTNTDPVRFSLIQKPAPSFQLPNYDGIVFLDVFQSNQIPHSNTFNAAMLYLVPPNNYGTNYPNNQSFLNAVQASSQTIIKAMCIYNSQYATPGNLLGLSPIPTIRMCLFSGNIYKGNATVADVAQYNLKGLELGFNDPQNINHGITLVEFEFPNVAPWLSPT